MRLPRRSRAVYSRHAAWTRGNVRVRQLRSRGSCRGPGVGGSRSTTVRPRLLLAISDRRCQNLGGGLAALRHGERRHGLSPGDSPVRVRPASWRAPEAAKQQKGLLFAGRITRRWAFRPADLRRRCPGSWTASPKCGTGCSSMTKRRWTNCWTRPCGSTVRMNWRRMEPKRRTDKHKLAVRLLSDQNDKRREGGRYLVDTFHLRGKDILARLAIGCARSTEKRERRGWTTFAMSSGRWAAVGARPDLLEVAAERVKDDY